MHKIIIFEHCMQVSTSVTPKYLKLLVLEAINAYPHNVEFLKKYFEYNRPHEVRCFLQVNIGNGLFFLLYLIIL